MPASTSPIFELVPVCKGTQFTSTDTTTKKTLLTAGTNGTRIDEISLCTNDTAAVNLALYADDGTTSYYLGVINIPIGSGYTTVVKVNGMATIAPPATGCLILPSGSTLKANCVATMTGAKTTDVLVMGGDF